VEKLTDSVKLSAIAHWFQPSEAWHRCAQRPSERLRPRRSMMS